MPKITPRDPNKDKTIVVKTKTKKVEPGEWWNASSKQDLCNKLLATHAFLKQQNEYRYRQASMYARLYGNMPLFGWVGSNLTRITTKNQLPSDRPTMSVITSGVDTVTSRLSLSKPRPLFLTDNGDTSQRTLAKQLNSFIAGEFYQTNLYHKAVNSLRDGCVWGTGVLKCLEDQKKRVAFERRLNTQLLVDDNDAFFGEPRMMMEMMLIDRGVAEQTYGNSSMIEKAEAAYPDTSADSEKTVSDQIMVVESWRLPSSPEAGDGLHVMACSSGLLMEEKWNKERFPFAFMNYSEPQIGFWGQGMTERGLGLQMAINQLLMTIHTSINLVGVPRVFVEEGSKVVGAHLNNSIGSIVKYRGTKPSYEIAPCVPVELYQQLDRLIKYFYDQEGISQLAAASQKPAGLNSGEALREYDDIQSDRFAALEERFKNFHVDCAYLAIDKAVDIAKRDGKYQTVFPDKNGTQKIDLPKAAMLEENPFVIQCYDVSSLPRQPEGRLQKVTEMMQAGIVSPQEGRRLLNFPDIEQEDKLAMAGEERILKILDDIVEHGKYVGPDPFMDLDLASTTVVQYYNLYVEAKLSEDRRQKLQDFWKQVQDLKQQAASALAPPPQAGAPQANPMPAPQSEEIPNVPGAQGAA